MLSVSEGDKKSTGRFGERKKVRLSIMVDKWISDALGKIRSKKSVSSLVNGLLGVTIMQFDPGPSSPLIYELRALFKKHLLEAEISGDAQSIACIEFLESQLVPYYDLAEVAADDDEEEETKTMGKGPQLSHAQLEQTLSPSRQDRTWFRSASQAAPC